jgi:hypothetical protein
MRRVRNITLSQPIHDAIAARADASGESFSQTIERLWDEAGSNMRQLRSGMRPHFEGMHLHLAIVRGALGPPADAARIRNSLAEISRLVSLSAIALEAKT